MDSSKGQLRLDALYGLGNRLTAILSAWVIARHEGFPLAVTWRRSFSHGSYCRFRDLFEEPFPPGLSVEELDKEASMPWPHCNRYPHAATAQILAGESLSIGAGEMLLYDRLPAWQFFDELRALFQQLRPTQAVRDLISAPTGSFLGLHTRFTDHLPAHITTPRWVYRRAVAQVIEEHPHLPIWACGDDPLFLQELKHRYPERITLSPVALVPTPPDRKSVAGIQAALADILCLARARVILASPHSSFSQIGSYLGHRCLHPLAIHSALRHRYTTRALWTFAGRVEASARKGRFKRVSTQLLKAFRSSLYQDHGPLAPRLDYELKRLLTSSSRGR